MVLEFFSHFTGYLQRLRCKQFFTMVLKYVCLTRLGNLNSLKEPKFCVNAGSAIRGSAAPSPTSSLPQDAWSVIKDPAQKQKETEAGSLFCSQEPAHFSFFYRQTLPVRMNESTQAWENYGFVVFIMNIQDFWHDATFERPAINTN